MPARTHARIHIHTNSTHISDTLRHTPTVNNLACEYGCKLCFFILLVLQSLSLSPSLCLSLFFGCCLTRNNSSLSTFTQEISYAFLIFVCVCFFISFKQSKGGKWHVSVEIKVREKKTIDNLKCKLFSAQIMIFKWGCKLSGTKSL